MKFDFPPIAECLSEKYSTLNPNEQWSTDEFINNACSESWNLDEYTLEGYLALKHLFYRIIIPKEHWEECTFEKFVNLAKQRYMEQISED